MKETLDLSLILPWVGAFITIAGFVALLKQIFGSGEKANADRIGKVERVLQEQIDAQETKLIEHDRRIQTVEGELKHVPDRDTAHRMELTIERMAGQLATLDQRLGGQLQALDERMKPVDALGRRLQEFLIDQAGKR